MELVGRMRVASRARGRVTVGTADNKRRLLYWRCQAMSHGIRAKSSNSSSTCTEMSQISAGETYLDA